MIHLVNMPFASLVHPNLALSLFKAQLDHGGIGSEVFNFNFTFARNIGFGNYSTIAFLRGAETQLGEWMFAREAWGDQFGPTEDEFVRQCGPELEPIAHVPDKVAWLRLIRHDVVPRFMDACLAELEEYGEPQVVGFSCSFFQTVASLALGRRIKSQHPSATLVYGGACFHGDMGDEFIRKIPWIDVISTGEADEVILPLMRCLQAGQDPVNLHGVHYRDSQGLVRLGPPARPTNLNEFSTLPDPDYSSFFRDASRVGLDREESWRQRAILLYESSRGCWWGQKHHCTFCGLAEHLIPHRTRPGAQVYEQLARLARRYPQVRNIQATDNILSVQHFRDLLPRLEAKPLPGAPNIFYSVKANMTRAQIRALARAGIVYVQPGIESLSTHLLRLMNKGVDALQNVFFMKVCREYGITVYWNLLTRLPGEQAEDYERMAEWLPSLVHLKPPYSGATEVECHRFSPYYERCGQWASAVYPQPWYQRIFAADQLDLNRVAFYFGAEWHNVLPRAAYGRVEEAIEEWMRIWYDEPVLPQLRVQKLGGGAIEIIDTRRLPGGRVHLDAIESYVYHAIASPTSLRTLQAELAQRRITATASQVLAALEDFVDAKLALEEEGRYLALALVDAVPDPSLEARRQHMKARLSRRYEDG